VNRLLILIFIFFTQLTFGQQNSFLKKSDTLNLKKQKVLMFSGVGAYAVSTVGLNSLWYSKYPKTNFHFINDNYQWLQMDKIGHAMTSYYVGKIGMNLMNWAGESKKDQLLYGASLGFVFLTTVEIMDGYSKEWGFSTGDILANFSGTSLLVGQELLWKEQRIMLKYSFHTTNYASLNPNLLGSNFFEQSLKDYNGQTYWLSFNIWSFDKRSNFPKWLNIAIGYGGENMLHGSNYPKDDRYRQYYLSLDIDLTKINTKSKFFKAIFNTLNFIKIPAPTLEYSSKERLKFLFFYF
jgi:hypothetical protein